MIFMKQTRKVCDSNNISKRLTIFLGLGGWGGGLFHTLQDRYIFNVQTVVLGSHSFYSCSTKSFTNSYTITEVSPLQQHSVKPAHCFLSVWLITLHQDAVSNAWDNYKWLCRRFHNTCIYGQTAFPFAINYFHLKL